MENLETEFQGKLDDNKNMYDFKSLKCLPPVNKMENFENKLLLIVKNIEFKNVKNEFQEILKEGINNEIKTSDKIFVVAGKSRHIYKIKKQYTKLLTENITETYEKSNNKKITSTSLLKRLLKIIHRWPRPKSGGIRGLYYCKGSQGWIS